MVYWNHNTLANNMNQIEFIEALRATTSNIAGTVLDLATKALAPEMHMGQCGIYNFNCNSSGNDILVFL